MLFRLFRLIPSGRIARGTFWSFSLRIFGVGFGFFAALILTRVIGITGYGVYVQAQAWVAVLAIPAKLGLDKLLVREVAVYAAQENWGLLRGLLSRSNLLGVIGSASVVSLAVSVTLVLPLSAGEQLTFLFAFLQLPFLALSSLRQSTLQGFRRVALGQIPELAIQPVAMVALVLALAVLTADTIEPYYATSANLAAAVLAFLCGTIFLIRTLPRTPKSIAKTYRTAAWLRSSLPFVLIAGTQTASAQLELLVLGALQPSDQVAIYSIANRYAGLILFGMFAVNTPLAPAVAGMISSGAHDRAQRMIRKAARYTLAGTVPLALGMIFCAEWLLLPFGRGMLEGETSLILLVSSKVFIVALGPAGLAMVMMNRERAASTILLVSVAIQVSLDLALVPLWGIEGAAAAAALSGVFWSASFWLYAKRRLGVRTDSLARL